MAEKRDYPALVEEKKTELSSLHGRMDKDRELVELAKYALLTVDNNPVPNSLSVTLNDPAVFAANVEASLNNATEQVVVESDDKNLDTAYIEDVIKACFAAANSRLVKQGRFPLNPYLDQQMCRRGRGAARCFFHLDKKTKTLIADIVPWDARYVYHGVDVDGLAWSAYETTRSRDMIQAEYPKSGITEESAIVLDAWDKEHNEVWIGGEKKEERKNPYGHVPVAIQLVPMGSMMADKDSMAHQGESIFFLIRDLIPELNRLVSIIQSLNMKALDNALMWKNEQGIEGTPPTHEDLTKPGNVTPTDIRGGAEPVNIGELKRSAYLLHTMIETRIQRGSLSSVDMGTLQFQLSAVALIEIGEGRDQVFLPRLGARGLLNQQLAEMIIEQILLTGATSFEIGPRGHKRTFDARKLVGEYSIAFKYFIKSPKVDLARFSMAAAAGGLIPDKAKRRDILQREDPEEDERGLRWQEAEMLSPAIKMNRTIQTLLEMAQRGDKHAAFEAELLSAEMGVNIKQMLTGDVKQQPKPETAEKPKPLVPLFGGGKGSGATTSARKAPELQAEPAEGEE